MKIYVMTDLEGAAMISTWAQTRDVTPEEKMRSEYFLTGEVNACVDGILDFDPDAEVIVCDGHGSGGVDEMLFHPQAKLIAGRGLPPRFGIDESYDALMYVGQHARAGQDSTLCHTQSSASVEYHKINGIELGEFGSFALWAGVLGVPTIFIAGDDVAVAEARELIPEIVGAPVKQSLGRELATHLSHEAACRLIRGKAREACDKRDDIEPFFMPGPYTKEIRLNEGHSLQRYLRPGVEIVDERTVRMTSDDVFELWP